MHAIRFMPILAAGLLLESAAVANRPPIWTPNCFLGPKYGFLIRRGGLDRVWGSASPSGLADSGTAKNGPYRTLLYTVHRLTGRQA